MDSNERKKFLKQSDNRMLCSACGGRNPNCQNVCRRYNAIKWLVKAADLGESLMYQHAQSAGCECHICMEATEFFIGTEDEITESNS